MPIDTASCSLVGNRDINQDRCAAVVRGETALLLLSDGMGGHPKGEEAARIMVETGMRAFETIAKPIAQPTDFLDKILTDAHYAIIAYGETQQPPIDPRATGVAVLVQDGKAYWAHAGDSRLYLFRDYRDVVRTTDHSFIEELRDRGLRPADPLMSKRYRNLVTQCLGGSGKNFSTSRSKPVALRDRDILLLCSDGLWNQLPEDSLGPQMRHHGSLERMVHAMANAAAHFGAPNSDNVTLLAMRWRQQEGNSKRPRTERERGLMNDAPDEVLEAIDLLKSAIEDFDIEKK